MVYKTLYSLILVPLFIFGMMTMSQATSSVEVGERTFDFKPVLEGTLVTHDFSIHNKGETALQLLRVRTTCGCTVADYPEIIAPGETGLIKVKANTTGYANSVFDRKVLVTTNDPANELIEFRISGKVKGLVRMTPDIVRLSGVAGTPISASVKVEPEEPNTFKLLSATPEQGDYIDVSFTKADTGYTIIVKNKAQNQREYFDRIRLEYDHPELPKTFIRVLGNISDKP